MRNRRTGAAQTRSMPVVSFLAAAIGLLALAGCGGSSYGGSSAASAPAGSATQTSSATSSAPATSSTSATSSTPAGGAGGLSVAANPEGALKFDTTSLSAKAGKVSIDFTNMAPENHNLTVSASSGAVVGATPTFNGASKTLSLNLKPGTYKFYCSLPGHRTAGMEGTLTVR